MISFGYDPEALGLITGNWKNEGVGEVHCACPFHGSEKTTVASFNVDKGQFFCFSCGRSADVYEIAQVTGGELSYVKLPPSLKNKTNTSWYELLSLPLAIDNPYLISRNVVNSVIVDSEIRAGKNFVAIPIKNFDGKIIGIVKRFTNRYSPVRYQNVGEDSFSFWGMETVKSVPHDEYVVMTEGIFGALRMREAGYRAIASLGAILSKKTFKYFHNRCKIIGWFDGDDAGYLAAGRLLKFHGRSRIILPGGETDELGIDVIKIILRDLDKNSTIHQSEVGSLYSKGKRAYYEQLPKENFMEMTYDE